MSRLLDGSWEEPPVLSTTRMTRQAAQPLTISLPSPSNSASPSRGRSSVAGNAGMAPTGVPSLASRTDQSASPASTLPDLAYHSQATADHMNAAANPILGIQRRPSGSVSPSSSASEPGGGNAAPSLLAGADWPNSLSVDTLSSMAAHAEWSSLMGLGTDAPRKMQSDPTFLNGVYQGQVEMDSQTSSGISDPRISGADPVGSATLAPSFFAPEDLSTLQAGSAMNVDFDISAEMRTGVLDESLLPLEMGDDATVAEAWRTFFQDPRFFNHSTFDMSV